MALRGALIPANKKNTDQSVWDFDPNVRKTDEDLDKVMHVVYLRQNKFKTYVEEDLDLSSNAIMETIVFSNENSQKGD